MNRDSTEDDASQRFAKHPLLTLEPPSCMFIFCPGVHIICLGLSSGSHTIWYEVLAFAVLQELVHQMPEITKFAGISCSLARAPMGWMCEMRKSGASHPPASSPHTPFNAIAIGVPSHLPCGPCDHWTILSSPQYLLYILATTVR